MLLFFDEEIYIFHYYNNLDYIVFMFYAYLM